MKKILHTMSNIPHDELRSIATLCGSMAVLIMVALFLSAFNSGGSLLTRSSISSGSQAACAVGCTNSYNTPVVSIYASSPTISSGGSSNMSYASTMVGGQGSTDNCGIGGGPIYISIRGRSVYVGTTYGPIQGSGYSNNFSWSTGPLTSNTTYDVSCVMSRFPSIQSGAWTTITIATPASISPPWADSYTVPYGGSTNFHWRSTNTVNCSVTNSTGPGLGSVASNGDQATPALTSQANFYFSCYDSSGDLLGPAGPVTINVGPNTTCGSSTNSSTACGFNATANTILLGQKTSLNWNCPAGGSYTSSQGDANYSTGGALSGSTQVAPTNTTNYTLTCNAPINNSIGHATVTVSQPVLSISAATKRVQEGSPATLVWSATNLSAGTQCSIASLPSGVFSASWNGSGTSWTSAGTQTNAIKQETIFTLSCQTVKGTQAASYTVELIPTEQEI